MGRLGKGEALRVRVFEFEVRVNRIGADVGRSGKQLTINKITAPLVVEKMMRLLASVFSFLLSSACFIF